LNDIEIALFVNSIKCKKSSFQVVLLLLALALNVAFASKDNSNLMTMLEKLTVPSSLLPSPQTRPIVIITAFNLGFRWHLLNFDCFMKRLSLPYLAVSMDEEGHKWIQRHNMTISTVFVPFHHELNVSTGTNTFRSHLEASRRTTVKVILQLDKFEDVRSISRKWTEFVAKQRTALGVQEIITALENEGTDNY